MHYSLEFHFNAKGLQRAMQIDLSEPLVRRVSAEVSAKRALLEHEKLHWLSRWRAGKVASARATVLARRLSEPRDGSGRFIIGMAFKRIGRVYFAHVHPTGTAEQIDRSPLGDDAQPRLKRSARVVGMPRR